MTHTMEMLGKTKVKVKDESVVDVGEPKIKYCPLFDKVQGIKEVTPEAAAGNMEFRKNSGLIPAISMAGYSPYLLLSPRIP